MKRIAVVFQFISIIALCLVLGGCDRKAKLTVSQDEHISDTGTIVDFPFADEEKGYSLTFAASEKDTGEYELKLYDAAGEIIQRISCGKMTEPVQFSYDYLMHPYRCLQAFSCGSQTGLLFMWNEEGFFEQAIEIPRYDQVRDPGFTVSKTDGTHQENTIYQVNLAEKRAEKLRIWNMQNDTGILIIRDCLEKKNIFEGKVEYDENGKLINKKYYDALFWNELPIISDNFINSGQGHILNSETDEVDDKDRQVILEKFGFQGKKPMYQYYDRYHNRQLELYLDEKTGKGCGIIYNYQFTSKLQKTVELYGVAINTIKEQEWKGREPFSLKSVYGTDGRENQFEDYQEICKYTKNGKLDHFTSQRVENWNQEEQICNILNIDFIYREDGTLYRRDYGHDDLIFGSTYCSIGSLYDNQERVIFEHCYITHGSIEYYYIYENDSKKPTYRLGLDYNMNMTDPELVRYQ